MGHAAIGSGREKSAYMNVGLLNASITREQKRKMRRALPLGILSLVAFLVWFVLLTGSDDVAAPNAAWRYWIPLTGLALGIVFWVLINSPDLASINIYLA